MVAELKMNPWIYRGSIKRKVKAQPYDVDRASNKRHGREQ